MWLPPKVRHLVLINQSPLLPPSFPPLLPLRPPLSFLPIYFLHCLFLERNLPVPGITLDWKQTHSSHQTPETKGILRLCLSREREKHLWLLIVEECLSKLWRYQAQSVAREGGLGALERRERGILLEKVWGVKTGTVRRCLLLLLSMQLHDSFSPPNPGRRTVGHHPSLSGVCVIRL